MSEEIKNKSWFRKNVIENHWIIAIAEYVGFLLLISHILPPEWLHTQWPFLVIVTIALLGLLISNFILNRKIIDETKYNYENVNEIKLNFDNERNELNRKAKYADVLPMLNVAFQELHNAVRRDYQDKTKYHEPFVVFCQNLEKVFTHLTGVECHVCIKMSIYPNGTLPTPNKMKSIIHDLQVKTYCRSSSSSSSRKQIDQKTVKHFIKENTDFEHIFKDNDPCYYCDDLATIDEYKNSSFKALNGGAVYFPKGTSFEEKSTKWPLDYRTTIIAPIRPLIIEENDEHLIIGLLCVDCKAPNVFCEEIDKHIIIGSADGIYNSFKKLFLPTQK